MNKLKSLFQGRISIKSFIINYLLSTLLFLAILTLFIYIDFGQMFYGLLFFVSVLYVLYFLSITVKRLHDIGHRGILSFLILISPLNVLLFLYLVLKKGTGVENKYGPPPYNEFSYTYAVIFAGLVIIFIALALLHAYSYYKITPSSLIDRIYTNFN
jgi:uncharacterized membrane protein YhaH (DUF805 family)